MNFRSSKFALLFGAINGFIFSVAFQPVKNSWLIYDNSRPRGTVSIHTHWGPNPLEEYFFLILVFMVASYTAHRFFAPKIKSDIILWQVVAIIAIGVPSVALYILKQADYLIGVVQAKFERGEWGYLPGLVPSQNDIEFGVLFLCLAMTINFFYGAIVGKLSKHFER